ncbi:MAG: serine hydrolase [Nannocystaceae bacterium]
MTHLPLEGAPRTASFRPDAEYLYPASAIKVFASVGFLLWLQEQRVRVPSLGLDAEIFSCEEAQCAPIEETSDRDRSTLTIGHVIRKMHLVSNNQAFNMLFDLVGHRELHERFWGLGYKSLRVHHRMYGKGDALAQRTTPRLRIRTRDGVFIEIPERRSDLVVPPTPATQLLVGRAHRKGGRRLVDEPMNFAQKNFVSMHDLHRLIVEIHGFGGGEKANLSLEEDLRDFLLDAMTTPAHESKNPSYPNYQDSVRRLKPTCSGLQAEGEVSTLKCANKAGNAYGFLIDNSLIKNTATGDAVAITVGIYVNPNEVINDNEYAYDEQGRPFMAALGSQLRRRFFAPL